MPSHLDSLGFNVADEAGFIELIRLTAQKGAPVYTGVGSYLQWVFGNGIELWTQSDDGVRLIGLNPHYSGSTTQIVGLSRKFPHPESPMDGAFEAWINPEIDLSYDPPEVFGDYPFIFDSPGFDWFQNIPLPAIARVQLAAFAHDLEIFEDEAHYKPRIKGEDYALAPYFFIPSGTFAEVEGKLPEAAVIFGGYLLHSKTLTNKLTGKEFTLATVQTYCMDIDILIDPVLITQPLQAGQVLVGSYWVSGMIKDIIQTYDKENAFHQEQALFDCHVAGLFYQDAEETIKSLLFGEQVILKREPENEYDASAISVYTTGQNKLGYIPRNMNENLAHLMDKGTRPAAFVLNKQSEPYEVLTIRVYLP